MPITIVMVIMIMMTKCVRDNLKVVTSDFLTARSVSPSRTLPECQICRFADCQICCHCFSLCCPIGRTLFSSQSVPQFSLKPECPTHSNQYNTINASDTMQQLSYDGAYPRSEDRLKASSSGHDDDDDDNYNDDPGDKKPPPCTTRMRMDVGQAGSNSWASRQISANASSSFQQLSYQQSSYQHIIHIL